MVADVFSKKYLHMSMLMVRELDLIELFRDLGFMCEMSLNNTKLSILKLTSGILEEIRERQKVDS